MAGAVACNVGAAVMDVFGFVLLIPFLNALFQQPALSGANALGGLLEAVIGRLLDPRDQMGSLQNVILVILASVALKSLFSWAAGNFGAALAGVRHARPAQRRLRAPAAPARSATSGAPRAGRSSPAS
jgi:hypothetical protein